MGLFFNHGLVNYLCNRSMSISAMIWPGSIWVCHIYNQPVCYSILGTDIIQACNRVSWWCLLTSDNRCCILVMPGMTASSRVYCNMSTPHLTRYRTHKLDFHVLRCFEKTYNYVYILHFLVVIWHNNWNPISEIITYPLKVITYSFPNSNGCTTDVWNG